MSKKVQCPKCKSTDVVPMGENKKEFSIGKTIGGGLLLGPVGMAAGFIGKKKGYDFYCQECRRVFTIKK